MKKKEEKMTKQVIVGIYVRVSTIEQAMHGYSIRAQIERLTTYCKAMGWQIHNVYTDEGISAKNMTDRPQMQNMLDDIQKGIINNVLVLKVDRLTRNMRDLIDFVELINLKECQFTSMMEMIDTSTATGRMFLKVIGIFAEFERENTSERVVVANTRKVQEGYCLYTWGTCFGYDRNIGERDIYINESEAITLKEIENMFLTKGYSYNKIAYKLNLRGVKTKQGNYWCSKSIKYVLSNPVYHGKTRHHTEDSSKYTEGDGKHEPLRCEETYNKIIEKMANVKKITPTKHSNDENYFLGVLYCSICGKRLSSHIKSKTLSTGEKKSYTSYVCMTKKLGLSLCDAKQIAHSKMETAFVDYISKYSIEVDTEIVDKAEISQEEKELELLENIKTELEKRIEKLNQKEQEIITLYVQEELDYKTFTQLKQELQIQKDNIKEELNEVYQETKDESVKLDKADIITNLKDNWLLFSDIDKYNFLQKFVHKIIVVNKPKEGSVYGDVTIEEIIFNEEINE